MDYNYYRPHSSLDYMARTAFAAMCLERSCGTFGLTQDREIKYEIFLQQAAQKTMGRS